LRRNLDSPIDIRLADTLFEDISDTFWGSSCDCTVHSTSNVASISYVFNHLMGGIIIGPNCVNSLPLSNFNIIVPGVLHFLPLSCLINTLSGILEVYDLTFTSVIAYMVDTSMSIYRYHLAIKYHPFDTLKFADSFILNENWSYLSVKVGNRLLCRGYMNKSPYIAPNACSLMLVVKNTPVYLNPELGTGWMISFNPECIAIPDIVVEEVISSIYTQVFERNFDFHVMMTVIACRIDVTILEHKKLSLASALIMHNGIKIEIHSGIIAYTGVGDDKHVMFKDFCTTVWEDYVIKYQRIKYLYDMLDNVCIPDPNETHYAIAYKTWFSSSRENQREWPTPSRYKVNDKSIEFPKNSGIWYSSSTDNTFVGITPRHDLHTEIYIPRIYKTDHRKIKSYLSCYIDDTTYIPSFAIPSKVKEAISEMNGTVVKPYRPYTPNTPGIWLNMDGSIISITKNAMDLIYNGMIVGSISTPIDVPDTTAQLLDNNNNRIKILNRNNLWVNAHGPRIDGIITIPWYYKQIIHDYNVLGRLDDGPVMDLMHIGIVDTESTDRITFPVGNINDLYTSRTLQTHILATVKFQKYVYDFYSASIK
jgi:hypothetical protein